MHAGWKRINVKLTATEHHKYAKLLDKIELGYADRQGWSRLIREALEMLYKHHFGRPVDHVHASRITHAGDRHQ